MAGFGRPPKPDAQRRNRHPVLAQQGNTRLPAAGRVGKLPKWPLSAAWKDDSDALKRERIIWARLWKTPQAVAWETLGWLDVVARYARLLVVAEAPNAPVALYGEVRQLEDRLGLTPMAMLRLRWIVTDDAAGQDEALEADNVLDVRRRLKAVDE
jgi:hypothetical protein